jgi:hypothetical protein
VKQPSNFAIDGFHFVAIALLLAHIITPALAQQGQIYSGGVVDDWTHRHVVFSNPGTMEDAIQNGMYDQWLRVVTDPRYRMQWIKRNAASAVQMTADSYRFGPRHRPPDPGPPRHEPRGPVWEGDKDTIHGDWTVTLAGGSGTGPAPGMYPAKFSFSTTATPDCTNDFVVFPITPSPVGQANLIGVNNLYTGTCTTGTVPNFLFAYDVGNGGIRTSPVLSENGAKVAFVESITNGSIFHVLTLDKRGNSGCPSSSPCNGTAFNSPAVPCTVNGVKSCSTDSAVDTKITMSGGVSVTRSSPFVDYTHDIAYVGDDNGALHKFTGVFNGTPAEAASPWPFAAAVSILGGPVYDSSSTNIFVGSANGNLHCVTSAGANCSTALISVASGTTPGAVLDAPIVDSTNGTVFAAANNSTNSVLLQVTTALGSPVRATMGASGTDLYHGAFDNAYLTSATGTGYMYFCGNVTDAATPALWRVAITSGTMSTSNDAKFFQLVLSGNTGASVDCTPLTEIFNGSTDYLFLGVKSHGFMMGTPNCANQTCVMSFSLPTASPFTFPSSANATTTSNLGTKGTSGIIIDNISGSTGASQIYFGNLQVNTGVQASQSALK